jgi:Cu+-exporting ATPase
MDHVALPQPASPPEPESRTATDPVCGMTVDPVTAPHHFDWKGTIFHFCSAGCRGKFAADPGKYLGPSEEPHAAEPGATYTCPMHPEVRQIGPGNCPICGMALEPVVITAEPQANPELADMKRRFWIGLVLTLPVVGLDMGDGLGLPYANWLQLILATPVFLWID